MRYPEAEKESFTSPTWTAEMVRQYTGPVVRCVVSWIPKGASQGQHSDLEAPSTAALKDDIRRTCEAVQRDQGTVSFISYGPHTEPER